MSTRRSALRALLFVLAWTSATWARPLTQEESSLYLDATDLPSMQRNSSPEPDDGGPGLGKAMWVCPDKEEPIGILQELRWVFPDEASADRWLTENVKDLSEGMEDANAPKIGDRSYAFGPSFPNAAALFGDQKPPRMINYVFRVGRVVVKLFVSGFAGDDSRLTPLFVSPLAVRAADRVRQNQKRVTAPPAVVAPAVVAPAVVAPPATTPEPATTSEPQAAPEPPPEPEQPPAADDEEEDADDDHPVPILVSEGYRWMIVGRYSQLTNLLNQPNREAGSAGVGFQFSLFSGGMEDTTGFAVYDAVDLELDIGLRTSADYTNAAGEVEDMWAYGYGAHYALAFGYRFEPIGILVGARPALRGLQIGGASSSDAQVPLMALLELRPTDDFLLSVRGEYGFFLDQNVAGLSFTGFFEDEFFLRFDYEQYRMSTAVPADNGGDPVQVGRQVSNLYTFGLGKNFE